MYKRQNCDDIYLHQSTVTVYERAEDAPTTIETEVDRRGARVTAVPSAVSTNPSLRRQGLAVAFWCEGCDGDFELTIDQHKGQTYIQWRRRKERCYDNYEDIIKA